MYLGSALSSFSILAIKNFGWRDTFKGMGLFGMFIGTMMILIMKEPRALKSRLSNITPNQINVEKEIVSDEPKEGILSSFKNSLIDVMKNPVSRNVTIAGMFNYAGGYAMMFFMPAFF